jgi:raffinose/stachyose/melibiose transport system permease protein
MAPTNITTRRDRIATSTVLWILVFLTVLPLALIVIAAITPSDQLVTGFTVPSHITGDNFRQAWVNGQFGHHLRVSAIVTSSIVLISAVGSILAGYALGTLRTPLRGLFAACFVLGIVIPYEALIIPLYYHLRSAALTDTYWALILPQSALSLAFGVYWMRGFFRSVPRSFVEAAWVEGASSWQLLWQILVPLARPAIATMIVLSFMWNWNEFLLPVVMISNAASATAPLALANFQGRFDINVAELAAGAIIVALPIMVLYIALQRRFIAGVVSASTVRGGGAAPK